jgi:4-alpha-glucanotransferase
VRRRGLLTPGDDVVEALHRYLALTPARLLCVALTDAVGDRRAQNQPGTTDEYPNWRVPLAGPDGVPMPLEDVFTSARARRLAETVRPRGPHAP